ncbi:MAG: DNA polymerase III subunit alpha, partial [Oscillospiraceae bacterium]|nr:DNA polymerase III subunit alpha [Oscillospiraceae bacterium]
PIIGCEVYVAPRAMTDRVHGIDNEAYHLVLLCKNEEGYRNLSYLVSMGFLHGFYGRPRVDLALLRKYSGGLIALSACLAGAVPRKLMQEDYAAAKAEALMLAEIFGPDSFYLEVQDHGIKEQKQVNAGVMQIARETGLPLVVTNDAHYLTREDSRIQDVRMCIQMGKTVDDPERMRFETDEFYIKSEDEMRSLFPNLEEAFENTAKIAERCNLEITFGTYHLPEFKLPPGEDSNAYFRALCRKGFGERYENPPAEYVSRLEYEMEMIEKMGYVDYFLIVSDFVAFAKNRGIPVGPGRGSAAGSIVSYCLRITDLDPMRYSLYFERFLNPERVSMPDIDIDFCQSRRSEVIEYVTQKYGSDHVAQIVTFGTLAARAAIRDVGRAMNFTYAETDAVAKLIPTTLHMTLGEALKVSPQLKEKYDADERVKTLIDTARALEGMPRNTSTHAAGVVITRRPVYDYVPLSRNDETVVTQFTMTTIEELGLLKMDFLGLRNLTVIEDAVREIRKHTPQFDMSRVALTDEATYRMLGEGKTAGVFQMESAGITNVCVQMKPTSLEDITAIVALYRPGPMDSIPRFIANKHNSGLVTYKTPQLESILSVTYGCIVYQEQVIEIFRRLGGYTLGQSDNMRRAISKKKQQVIVAERKAFVYGDPERGIPGAIANGVSEQAAQEIYDEILDFANYAFNKAHAVCYAKIAYDTAWLKCHYPREYMAALMTSVLDSSVKVAGYIAECKSMGIAVLPPDINESEDNFTPTANGIRFGIAAVKNIGKGLIRAVVRERENGGPYRSLEDLCKRTLDTDLNKRAMENLIKCGALDCFGLRRSQLLRIYDVVMDSAAESHRQNVEGQIGLFDLFSEEEQQGIEIPDIPELRRSDIMAMEKEAAGIYLSGHPMDDYRPLLRGSHVVPIGEVFESFAENDGRFHDDQIISVAGIIQKIRRKTTRNNSIMAYVTLEDDTGMMEALTFSSVLTQYASLIRENLPVVFVGRVSVRDEKEPQIVVNSVRPIDAAPQQTEHQSGGTLFLKLPSESGTLARKVNAILNMFPGKQKTVLYFADSGKQGALRCAPQQEAIEELRRVLGNANVIQK